MVAIFQKNNIVFTTYKFALTCMSGRFIFVVMAYNRRNYLKTARYIVSVYNQYKFPDVPDSKIVRVHFPQHNIHITYRQWMNIKGMVIPKEDPNQQLSLFN